jgi:hypothetical protein
VTYSVALPNGSDLALTAQVVNELSPETIADATSIPICSSLLEGCCPDPLTLDSSTIPNGYYLILTAEPVAGCAADGGALPTLESATAVAETLCAC